MDDVPAQTPPLISVHSTPVYSDLPPAPRLVQTRSSPGHLPLGERLRPMTMDDIEAHRIGRDFLRTGRQVFTPLTLQRIASSDVTASEESEDGRSAHVHPPQTQEEVLSIDAMMDLIINESETMQQTSTSGQPESLNCIVCYDDLNTGAPESRAAYHCSNADCSAALCEGCLYRQVDVTIKNALYAVPRIRCPGTCMQRISTAMWRGALNGVAVPSDEPAVDRKPLQELVNAIVHHTDSFIHRDENTCLTDLCELYDAVSNLLRDKQVTFSDVYNAAYELCIIPSQDSSAVDAGLGSGDGDVAALAASRDISGDDDKGDSKAEVEAESESNIEVAVAAPTATPTPVSTSHPVIRSFSTFSRLVLPAFLPGPDAPPADPAHFETTELVDCLHSSVLTLGFADAEVTAETVQNVICYFMALLAVCLRTHDGVIARFEEQLRQRRSLDTASAENSLMKRYSENAEALMAMRCGGCDATTGLFYSEANRMVIATASDGRRSTLQELTRGLEDDAVANFLKVLIDFNSGRATAEQFVGIIYATYTEKRRGTITRARICCPRGHVMVSADPSSTWACDGNNEVQGCAFGREVLATTLRWRCQECDFDYCDACYSARKDALERYNARSSDVALEEKCSDENSSAEDSLINEDGIRTVLSQDTIHTRQMRHYCGRVVGRRGYFNGRCRRCDGTCGPRNGCQCTACFRMDSPGAVRGGQSTDPQTLDEYGWQYMHNVLSLFLDIERRCALQLELFRKYPKITTPCCGHQHCFLCKITGHHPGRTCDEVQRAAFGQECQYCPACNVPTLRTEGCDHIICPCGRNWQWDVTRDGGEFVSVFGVPPQMGAGQRPGGGRGGGRGLGRGGGRGLGRGLEGRAQAAGRGLDVPPVPHPAVSPGRGLFGVPFQEFRNTPLLFPNLTDTPSTQQPQTQQQQQSQGAAANQSSGNALPQSGGLWPQGVAGNANNPMHSGVHGPDPHHSGMGQLWGSQQYLPHQMYPYPVANGMTYFRPGLPAVSPMHVYQPSLSWYGNGGHNSTGMGQISHFMVPVYFVPFHS